MRRLLGRASTPAVVAAAVLGAYVVWAAWFLATHSPEQAARPGEVFLDRGEGSAPIEALRDDAVTGFGYDGQFFLYWALDPTGSSDYVDVPEYRFSRILYPLLARVLGAGQAALVPVTMLLVGLAAVALATYALALLLRRRGASPLWALLYGAYPGTFLAVSHDLAEPLAYSLVAAGLLVLDRDGAARPYRAAVLFGLAGVARETTLIFPVVLAACAALGLGEGGRERPRRREALALAAIAAAPYLALKLLLTVIYGAWRGEGADDIALVPFSSFVDAWAEDQGQAAFQIASLVVPGLVALAVAVAVMRRLTPSIALLAVNFLVLVAMLPRPSLADYLATGRIATGVVVAFLLALPAIRASSMPTLVWVPILPWLAPLPFVGELAKGT